MGQSSNASLSSQFGVEPLSAKKDLSSGDDIIEVLYLAMSIESGQHVTV